MPGKELLKLCLDQGGTLDRINGSHHVVVKEVRRAVPIPIHGSRDLPRSLETAIANKRD